jgi:solute:Na+ symporter, SSS family
MVLAGIDWAVIGLYFILSIGVALYFTKRSSQSTDHFFLGGRNVSWWLAGLSMVATTFAADTPLAVTEMVRKNGISGNWLWWNFLIGGIVTTFFFAKYWHRAGVMTDLELISVRYSGRSAFWLRGMKAIYFGLFMNTIILAWVNVAMRTIIEVYFGLSAADAMWIVALLLVVTAIYTTLSGLLGVLYTDAVQFVIAMVGCIVLAYIVLQLDAVNGLSGLSERLSQSGYLSFWPTIGDTSSDLTRYNINWATFFTFIGVQWWASWYPGAEPGGGGYIAQRMMSTNSDKSALSSALLFQFLHYAVRPWPWIIVALATFILYPNLSDQDYKQGFVMAMRDYLPAGLQGLLLVAFFAAYMSTISTHLNWGVSYLLNDAYKPFYRPIASEKHYVIVAKIMVACAALLALFVTPFIVKIEGAWLFILECGAGTGLVLMLRWYWWKVSAWSEIIAMVVPLVVYSLLFSYEQISGKPLLIFPYSYLFTVAITTMAWVGYTLINPMKDNDQLSAFYNRVKPQGLWKPFAKDVLSTETPLRILLLCSGCAVVLIYALLFGVGQLLFAGLAASLPFFISGTIAGLVLYWLANRYALFR